MKKLLLLVIAIVLANATLSLGQTNLFPSSGNVGIGTTSPASPLHIVGNTTLQGLSTSNYIPSIFFKRYSDGNPIFSIGYKNPSAPNSNIDFNSLNGNPITFSMVNVEKMSILENGNVGIGTTTPAYKLDVNGDMNVLGTNILSSLGGKPNLQFYRAGYNNWLMGSQNNSIDFGIAEGTSANYKLYFQANTGNIGIGTTNPVSKLQVAGAISITPATTSENRALNFMAAEGTNAKYASIETNSTSGNLQIKSGSNSSGAGFSTSFFTDEAERMRISSAGNIGIGTTNPINKFHVVGNTRLDGNLNIFNSVNKIVGFDDPVNYYLGHYPVTGTAGLDIHWYGGIRLGDRTGNVMQVADGNVGIGTTTPQTKLDVRGSILAANTDYVNGTTGSILQIQQGTTSGNTYSEIGAYTNGGAAWGNLILNRGGNVGIGTTTPTQKLDLIGKQRIFSGLGTDDYTNVAQHNGQFRINNGIGSKALEIALLDNGTGVIQANESGVGYNNLALNPVNGNVGIGTTTPSNKLEIFVANKSGLTLKGLGAKPTEDWQGVSKPLAVNASGEVVVGTNANNAPTVTFEVKGEGDKYYPVVFKETEDVWANDISEFTLSHANVHRDAEWWGSAVAKFRFHSNRWGHGSSFVEPSVYQYKPNQWVNAKLLVAGWKETPYSAELIVWLRGKTTYSFKGNTLNPIVFDGVQNPLPYKEINGAVGNNLQYLDHNPKTTIDPYIEDSAEPTWKRQGANIFTANPGNVGIGTTTPQAPLDVNGRGVFKADASNIGLQILNNSNNIAQMQFANINSGNHWYIGNENGKFNFYNGKVAGGGYAMSILDNGNVGVGTTNPTARLDVNGTANFSNSILLSGGSGTATSKIGFNADGNNYFIQGITNGIQYSPYSVGNFSFTSGSGNWKFVNGSVNIGATNMPANYKLAVGGDVIAERVVVKLQANWPDYVFKTGYSLRPLSEVEAFVRTNNHLPDVPSEAEIKEKGIDMEQMNATLLKKVEELTLYLIDIKKENIEMKKQNDTLLKRVENLEKK
jgi:hypothetical protein